MTGEPAAFDIGADDAEIGSLGQYRRERLRVATKSLRNAWVAYARDNAALGALAFVLLVALLAILAPWISPYDPDEAVTIRHAPVLTEGLVLGADGDGRDRDGASRYAHRGDRRTRVVHRIGKRVAIGI